MPRTRHSRARRIARGLLGSVLSILVALVVFEAMARIGSAMNRHAPQPALSGDAEPPWYVFTPDLGWEARPRFAGDVDGAWREYDGLGYLAADAAFDRPKGFLRVLFLGDSRTFGWKLPYEATFTERLERLLQGVDAVNLALPGYTSYQGLRAFEKRGLRLRPDVVVVSFGFNDRRYVSSAERIDGADVFARQHSARRFHALLSPLRSLQVFQSMRYAVAGLPGVSANPEDVRLDRLPARVGPDAYRGNLLRIVDLARSNGIAVVFLTLGDNPLQTEPLRKGVGLLRAGRPDEAGPPLQEAIERKNWFSDLARLELARARRAIVANEGSADRLRRTMRLEMDTLLRRPASLSAHGGYPIHLDTDYIQVMESVARAKRVAVIDAVSIFREHPEEFMDFCHLDANGHERIARLLARHFGPRLARVHRDVRTERHS